jgi:YXWGXW repeat-containing protein
MRIARFICSLLLAVGLLTIPVQSHAQVAVGISVRIGPPVLPVYVQPFCPGPGYIWVPGYWAYGPDGYFWVPGTWVFPPEVGLLWTPGYWAFDDGFYVWYPGYWGPVVGFYGGINYGFGYTGVGFFGGYWRGGTFFYNRAVTNVDVTVVRNTYNTTVINNNVNRVSFNGGSGGTTARPTSQELSAARQHHVSMTSEQTQHQQAASTNRSFLASVNHGRPEVAATPRPGQFNGRGAVESGKPVTPSRPSENPRETNRPGNTPANNNGRTFENRPPTSRPSNAPRVNPGLEQKQQREVEKLRQRQDAERQKVQQRHVQEQQKLERQRVDQRQQEQVQRRQQQQLDQMQQKHAQQSQKLQERQQNEVQKQQPKEKKEPKGDRPPGH